ncbi:hypothetical protein FKP32DRAFT_580536 [Trametes sanguinea]|nr:hypothetical protein FKP32DRAFT_580536 [Trametes sanguinea]
MNIVPVTREYKFQADSDLWVESHKQEYTTKPRIRSLLNGKESREPSVQKFHHRRTRAVCTPIHKVDIVLHRARRCICFCWPPESTSMQAISAPHALSACTGSSLSPSSQYLPAVLLYPSVARRVKSSRCAVHSTSFNNTVLTLVFEAVTQLFAVARQSTSPSTQITSISQLHLGML